MKEFESFMVKNRIEIKTLKKMVSDSMGSLYSLWADRDEFAELYTKRGREGKRHDCRRLIKRLKMTQVL